MQAAADHRVAPAKLIIFWKQMLIQHVSKTWRLSQERSLSVSHGTLWTETMKQTDTLRAGSCYLTDICDISNILLRTSRFTGGTRSVGTHPSCFGPVPVLLSIPTAGLAPNFRAATEWMVWPVQHPEFFN
ncbi:hypothetical protein ACEPAH_1931 [Sanghuangporus vaninii]